MFLYRLEIQNAEVAESGNAPDIISRFDKR